MQRRQLLQLGLTSALPWHAWAGANSADTPRLLDLVFDAVPDLRPDQCAWYVVDEAYQSALALNPRLAYLEFIAKNVGVRRARGTYVLTTNCDVFLGRHVIEALAARALEPHVLYRAARHDLKLGAAYDALSPAMKQKLDGLIAMHAIEYSRKRTGFMEFEQSEAQRLPPVPQLLVRTIPESGRKSLYIASHIGAIKGMGAAEAEALFQQLLAHVIQRQFVFTHRWRVNDLVMWDNRCTLHRGTDFDDMRFVRDMRRATVGDVANTCEQAGVAVPA